MLPLRPAYYFWSERPKMIRYKHIIIKHEDCLDPNNDQDFKYPKYIAASIIRDCYVLIVKLQHTFEELAQQWSQCRTCFYGGDHGWVTFKNSCPHIRQFPFQILVGEMTLPVATSDGYEIFLRTE